MRGVGGEWQWWGLGNVLAWTMNVQCQCTIIIRSLAIPTLWRMINVTKILISGNDNSDFFKWEVLSACNFMSQKSSFSFKKGKIYTLG